jgi:Mn2+/Fe2+ NRAMP family transporter
MRPEDPSEQETGPGKPRVRRKRGLLREVGLGIVSGAADDDPSAIGTYASAGAKLGPAFLWIAPALLPMMYVVVYLSAKIGQVSGRGLFDAIRVFYPPWLLYPLLFGALIGNTIEAGADLGGIAAALNLLIPLPHTVLVTAVAVSLLGLQCLGTYTLIRNVFRWLALALLAYVASAILARPELMPVIKGTLIPHIELSSDFLSLLVAVMGASLSAYLFTWQSNVEVEEQVAQGRTSVAERRGATSAELRKVKHDVLTGMVVSNIVMYFVMLATASTLHITGKTDVESAAQAAAALQPVAGEAAGLLFALGIVGVGVLAVPVMTTGAAYDLVQSFGGRASLNARPGEAKLFYLAIAGFTMVAVAMNFLGFNPMRALVWAGIVQGFSTPALLVLMMLMTNDPRVVGARVNSTTTNVLGWGTTAAVVAANAALVVSWVVE